MRYHRASATRQQHVRAGGADRHLGRCAAVAALLAAGVVAPATAGSAAWAGPSAAPAAASHVDNPYLGGRGYVNPEWREKAEQIPGGTRVADNPTAVWLDTVALVIGSLNSRRGLRGHLDAAVAQGASHIQVVIHNLPGKDCDRAQPTGEFRPDDLGPYQREFIDPIVAIEQDPRYRSLRIINIVEPRWVRTMIINTGARESRVEVCDAIKESGGYVNGVRYALDRLHTAGPNVYTYLDAGSYDELGWTDNFGPAVALLADTVRGTRGGFATVDGFASNIGGYAAVDEPYYTLGAMVGGQPVRSSRWVDWNSYIDQRTYVLRMREALVRAGFDPGVGMVIDTSRNGWGGPRRPSATSTSTNVNTFVDESRVDRRPSGQSWCNQAGAGLGERPVAAPAGMIDAYAWIKNPGESDEASPKVPGGDARVFEPMCDPTYRGGYPPRPSGAMPGAPHSGQWFPAAFTELMANAWPALPLG